MHPPLIYDQKIGLAHTGGGGNVASFTRPVKAVAPPNYWNFFVGRQAMFVDISFLANLFKRRWVWIASTKTNIKGGPYHPTVWSVTAVRIVLQWAVSAVGRFVRGVWRSYRERPRTTTSTGYCHKTVTGSSD